MKNLTGLVLICPNTNISPTIYLEPYFEEIRDKSFAQIAEDIWQAYLKNNNSHEVESMQDILATFLKDFPVEAVIE